MTSIFTLGAVVFLFAFTFFKIAAFKKVNPEQSWKKLFAVTLIAVSYTHLTLPTKA